jgi:hypothetical protein
MSKVLDYIKAALQIAFSLVVLAIMDCTTCVL